MSQWGNLDRYALTGTVTANLNSTTITASTGMFTAANNVVVGYSILLANVAYKIATINAANSIVLDVAYAGSNISTSTAAIQQSPKDLSTYGWGTAVTGANTTNKQNTYGVDRQEVANTLVKAKGFNHTGWATYKTYTDAHSQTRNKAETLVAMSKNFNANAATNLQTDANDNTILPNG